MNQFRLAIHTDMRFQAEVLLLLFLRLMHLRISLLGPILRRTGRTDNRGIHNGPVVNLYAVRRQIGTDPGKELFPQLMRFQQMSKLADRRLIGHRLTAQINPDKLPQGSLEQTRSKRPLRRSSPRAAGSASWSTTLPYRSDAEARTRLRFPCCRWKREIRSPNRPPGSTAPSGSA